MTAPTAEGDLRTVRLLQLPVQVWAASQEHHDELLREFALMTVGHTDGDPVSAPVPLRLLRLVDDLTRRFAGTSDEQRERLFAAAAQGVRYVDELEYHLPPAAGPACVQLAHMLDEADEYCRDGEHLLTLATPDEVRLFRDWYLGDIARQLEGAPPEPWPDYAARVRGA